MKTSTTRGSSVVTGLVSTDEFLAFQKYAAARNISVSAAVRKAVRHLLEADKDAEPTLETSTQADAKAEA